MAYFSQTKGESDQRSTSRTAGEPAFDVSVPSGRSSSPDVISTLGRGMLVTGNITCTCPLQILGHVAGDIHATSLTIGDGAQVEGNVIAQEMVIHGSFKGTIHANSVKLQNRAMVDGEIFNKQLIIEQNAQFEGVSRRLEKAVEAPASDQSRDERPTMAEVVPISGAVG
jgi:cytoskeletal protein CcmA (bactofilin family)